MSPRMWIDFQEQTLKDLPTTCSVCVAVITTTQSPFPLTAVEGEVPSGRCSSVKEVDSPVQEVDSRFCVDYLEDLTEEQTELLCCCLKQYNQQRPSIKF